MGFLDWFMKNELPKGTLNVDSTFQPTNIPGVNAKINSVTPASGFKLTDNLFTNFLVDQATNVVTTYAIGLSLRVASKFMQSTKGQAAIRFLSSKIWNRFKYMFGFGATATTVHETSIDQKVFDQLFTPIVERVPISVPGSTTQNLGSKALEAVKSAAAPALAPTTPAVPVSAPKSDASAAVAEIAVKAAEAHGFMSYLPSYETLHFLACISVGIGIFIYYLGYPYVMSLGNISPMRIVPDPTNNKYPWLGPSSADLLKPKDLSSPVNLRSSAEMEIPLVDPLLKVAKEAPLIPPDPQTAQQVVETVETLLKGTGTL